MKKIMFAGFAFAAILTACNEPAKTVSQEGVYKLEKQVLTDGKTEYVKSSANGDVQYKIFTKEGYFYIGIGKDSSVGFGTGSYKQEGNTITESNIYNSGSHDTAWDAKLEITNNEKGYTQVIPSLMSNGVSYKDTEDYTKIEAAGTSALDGIWHQTKTIVVSGKDTSDQTYNEYKVYSAGHFMWATKYVSDTVTKAMTTLVGHGTFTLNNDALTENLDLSNRAGITGKYDIKIKFNGDDEYTQETADTVAKTVGFKTYKRIKK